MNIDFNAIINLLTSEQIQEIIFPVKIGFFVLAGLLLATAIFALSKSHYLQWLALNSVWEFVTFRPFGIRRITRIWNRILKRLETGLESEYKLAVIEADDILEVSLKRMGFAGETLEERLAKLTSDILPNIEDVHRAHKMRNSIIHDPDFRLTLEEAKSTLDIYAKSFSSLQILD